MNSRGAKEVTGTKNGGYQVAVIGFGYVGTVLSVFLAERGVRVLGVDSDPRVIDSVSSGKPHFKEPTVTNLLTKFVASHMLSVSNSFEGVDEAKVIIVTVGTPIGGNYSADLTALKDCISSVAGHMRRGQLLILKSTIPPGTTRNAVVIDDGRFSP